MISGTQTSTFGTQLLNAVTYPFRKLAQGFNYLLGDSLAIIQQKESFFFQELADRAVTSNQGYASTYLGLPFLRAFNFFVFTGDNFVKEAAEYGEYSDRDPSKFDPKARSLFDPIKDFLGDPSIINMNGPEVRKERRGIKEYLTPQRGEAAAWDVSNQILQNWSNEKSLNHMICLLCTRMIAQSWFNLKEVPEELIPLLKTAEHYVFNRDQVSKEDFERLRLQIKALNDRVLAEQSANLSEEDSYLGHIKTQFNKEKITDLNGLAALVVEGNITTVLTGAVLQLATNSDLQNRLREELRSLSATPLHNIDFSQIKNLPLLNSIYLESLRFYSPSPPMARYASQTGVINGVHIPARSFIFIPLRRIMHDPKQWPNPGAFDPSRHERSDRRLNMPPFTPFSTGSRVCPASFGFAESMFKIALVNIFKENILKLTSHDSVEQIPVAIKEPRFKQTYFGELRRIGAQEEHEVEHVGVRPTLLYSPVQSSNAYKKAPLVSSSSITSSSLQEERMRSSTSDREEGLRRRSFAGGTQSPNL